MIRGECDVCRVLHVPHVFYNDWFSYYVCEHGVDVELYLFSVRAEDGV